MDLAAWHRWWKEAGARELRALLMEHWDPIGVAGFPEAADEYDTYVGHIARMLREGKSADDISVYLHDVRTNWMGLRDLPESERKEAEVSARVVEWYENATRRRQPG